MPGRPKSPLDPNAGPVQRFAVELRALRRQAGSPTYKTMATRSEHGASTLPQAAAGERLPTLPVTLAYVQACNGDRVRWEQRWRQTAEEAAAVPRPAEDGEPPYRGLARYEPGDADLFFRPRPGYRSPGRPDPAATIKCGVRSVGQRQVLVAACRADSAPAAHD